MNFKVHIALFNFQSAVNHRAVDGLIIYHSFLSLSSRILYFFQNFFKFISFTNPITSPVICRLSNIALNSTLVKSCFQLFQKFFFNQHICFFSSFLIEAYYFIGIASLERCTIIDITSSIVSSLLLLQIIL